MARIHQCDDLVEGRFVIDADRIARHRLMDQPGTHAPASWRVFFDAKQFFQPVSGRRADIELGSMQEIAFRDDADKRPVVVEADGQDTIAIHPVMLMALSYDHRIVDGKEAVTFLKRIKDTLEDPARILLEV